MTSVVIVDDQALVRDGLRLILELADIEIVGEAADGAAAVELVRRTRPDVVLMDLRMPGLDGIAATRRIAAMGVPTRVLVLTTFGLDQYVYESLRAGAAGFLLKDTGRERLVEAVRTTAAGETPLAPAVLERIVNHYVRRPPPGLLKPPRLEALSAREIQVLRLVAAGYSNPEIAQELFISLATVKSHVRHILSKLGLRDRVQAVIIAYEAGLTTAGGDDGSTP
ncbi:response regulator [Microtetraspora niveoalba]|uniref:response regulator n=1 Tax=Microtetraspora niveoalba TaxID=46175 RepID=UPI0008341096|nr:response regulator transcription factor [Microtetraspora niveoalba]